MIELENDRRYLNQWALEQRVQIDNFLPGTWVEFSAMNDGKNSAIITESYAETGHVFANIPNVLLQSYGYLHVYVNPSPSDMAHTPEEKDFKVVRRRKPDHYIYTETPTVSYKSKADTFWGVENAGKAIVVGEDGYLTAEEKPSCGNGGGETIAESVDAEKVIFSEDLLTTAAIGNIKLENGQATIPSKGKSLREVWNSIFVQEKNPTTTNPSVSVTLTQAKAYEVGTKITPTYSAALKAGSYSYGPNTGVTATAWEVTDTEGNSATEPSGSFPELTVKDSISYKITAKATHGAGAVPVTNTGNEYAAGQIKAGSKTATSGSITGYRNSFYGTLTEKAEITSDIIRGLVGKAGAALANGSSFDVPIPVGALRVVIAYPATLRDVSHIKDVKGMSAEIAPSFIHQTVQVEGAGGYTAIDYKVYTMDFANPYDTANTFKVTI